MRERGDGTGIRAQNRIGLPTRRHYSYHRANGKALQKVVMVTRT